MPGTGADGDGDGAIGPADYDVWRARFGDARIPGAHSANVPEPSTAAILFAGNLLVVFSLRLRRRHL
jgi:hypothetical protein